MRNRRWKQKLGPLVIYDKDNGIVKAFRNIPGMLKSIIYPLFFHEVMIIFGPCL